MINYLKALNMKQAPPLTPYYAQLESNRHPEWPTHMLWAQLMSELIISILKNTSFYQIQTLNKNISSNQLLSQQHDIMTTFGICPQVYIIFIEYL